jgi:aldehyde:ferredoxin oxidoreductase
MIEVNIMKGWTGRILRVDLTKDTFRDESLELSFLQTYFGGRGLGARLLMDDLEANIDPLGPENEIIFATGPLTGVPVAGTTRTVLVGKSPLTGIYGESNFSGSFGAEIKKCGYDAIVVRGRAEKPVYLAIKDNEVEIRNAKEIWGKTTGEAHSFLVNDMDNKAVHTACIGIAGEKMVRFACVISDLFRAAGRTGLGAVMGSKRLKAIGAIGHQEVQIADSTKFRELRDKIAKELFKKGEGHRKFGTAETISVFNETGRLPTKGYREGKFAGADNISGEIMAETLLKKRNACFACPIACNRIVEAHDIYDVDPSYGGPEYETLAAFGSMCMNDNLVSICKANELCNIYGLDTIETGHSISFVMECFEKGLLDSELIGDLDLSWGNYETIIRLINQIAYKKDLGLFLSEGLRTSSSKLEGSESFALHIKGLGMPFHDPRIKVGMGLSFATSNRGACHLQSFSDSEFEKESGLIRELGMTETVDRARTNALKCGYIAISQDVNALYDSLVVCKWTVFPFGYSLNTLNDLISAVTGCNFGIRPLALVGERAFNLGRMFNVREGLTRRDDTIPSRFSNPLEGENSNKGTFSQSVLDEMLNDYYEFRGWDISTGIPTPAKLSALGLTRL